MQCNAMQCNAMQCNSKRSNIPSQSAFDIYLRYKQHKTDFEEIPSTRPILVPCRVSGCRCKCYHYVPLNGSRPIRCTCKHFGEDHSETKPYKCLKGCLCKTFFSSFTCGCGKPTHAHKVKRFNHFVHLLL